MSDIFERTRKRVEAGKDFDPDMVYELCVAYDSKISYLADALEEIAKGEGAFSRDRLEHATNVIENAIDIAIEALKET